MEGGEIVRKVQHLIERRQKDGEVKYFYIIKGTDIKIIRKEKEICGYRKSKFMKDIKSRKDIEFPIGVIMEENLHEKTIAFPSEREQLSNGFILRKQ